MRHGGGAAVAKASVPQVGGDGEGLRRGAAMVAEEGIEITGAIGPHDGGPSGEILHREAKRVKFNGTRIIANKGACAN
jgi:hypothetical protein